MRTTLPNKYANLVLDTFAQFDITGVDEFSLTPRERKKLYRRLLNLSDFGIKYSNWCGKCGRKILFPSPETAEEQRLQLNSSDPSLVVYLCAFHPKRHWHIGHLNEH